MTHDTKAREKAYLARSGSIAWERIKPFSPAGTDTLAESTRLIHDFAVALNALDAAPNHLILDLGAGACWTSEWLHRLNLRVVSTDIARDMLAVGRERAGSRTWPFVAGDFEALPFADGAFDRALCLNALHHVPSPARALAEMARVLTPGGRLVLVEPGRGHAANPTSVKAVEDFGVLEQELEASELMTLCAAAGFPSVSLLPLSYATTEIALTTGQVAAWRRWTSTKRPARALQKARRAVLDFFGLAKGGELFEDSLAIWISRVLARHVGEQGIVVASKASYAPAAGEWRAALTADRRSPGPHGADVVRITAVNAGTAVWRARHGLGQVRLGARLLDATHEVLREIERVRLPADVPPGGTCVLELTVPPARGAIYLELDLVCEQVAWFRDRGSPPLVLTLAPTTSVDRHPS